MKTSSRAPLFDLFKLIIAIILFFLFLFLWIWVQPAQTFQPEPAPATVTSLPPTEIPSPVPTHTLQATTAVIPASLTSTPPTETQLSTSTATPLPTSTLPPTVIPSPIESPVPETLPTPIVEIPAEPDVCEAISRSQLQVGMQATIQRHLNFRSSPGIRNNWLRTNIPGTQVEVVGGPECTRYENGGAYLWWQIKLPNGMLGWSAEASAFGAFYFMEPVQ